MTVSQLDFDQLEPAGSVASCGRRVRLMPNEDTDSPRSGGSRGTGLTPSIIEALKAQNMSQSDIARRYGVTRQAVSVMKRRYGNFSKTPREEAMEQFPWKVRLDHQDSSTDKRMRDHAEYMATGGRGMEGYKLSLLAGFYKRLLDGNLVVEYDPGIPPAKGNKSGGWALVARLDTDGDLMIRENEYTTLTEEGRIIYRIPKRLPASE